MKRSRSILPALLLLFTAIATSSGAATVSFEVDSSRPVVQLTVNGQGPFPFVFDTGSPSLLVGQSLADELDLEVVGRDELRSPLEGTPVPVDVVRVDSVALGDAGVSDFEARILEMRGDGLARGVVGPAVFREHGAMTLDFAGNTITLGEEPAAEIETWLPFGPSAPLLDAPVRIGDVVMDGHIDSGNPGVLALPNAMAERLPLTGPVETVGRARTVDAEFDIRAAPIDETAYIGDARVPLDQIIFGPFPVANLGTAGLRGLVLHIDWENERFALTGTAEPGPGPARVVVVGPDGGQPSSSTPGEGPRFGLMGIPSPDGAIEVTGTVPGSQAEAIGLLAGDRVVAANGKTIGELGFAAVRAELARPDLVLTVERDGETVRLTHAAAPRD